MTPGGKHTVGMLPVPSLYALYGRPLSGAFCSTAMWDPPEDPSGTD